MTEQTKSCITTWSGQWFDILKPDQYNYDIEEIAHALSNLCRYTGHINKFYSVAEHSVLVSRIVDPAYALAGLLHDAGEAYLGDVSSPLKVLLPEYKKIENSVERAICLHFGIEHPLPAAIKEADKRMYWQERQSVADNGLRDGLWHQDLRATRKVEAIGMAPHMAKRMFLARYREIMKNEGKTTQPKSKDTETEQDRSRLDVV